MNSTDALINILAAEDSTVRMHALHLLCEGYVQDDRILPAVFDGWQKLGTNEAYSEFPMVAYLPIPVAMVDQCCERARKMVQGRKITDLVCRSGGKLLEQLAQLKPEDLADKIELIESLVPLSKIFFRVDTAAMRERIGLLELNSAQLSEKLDKCIGQQAEDPNDVAAIKTGLHALEALRRNHPEILDLRQLLTSKPPNTGPLAISFQTALQSLAQFPATGLESSLGTHLIDEREAVYSAVVEALVRCGTAQAGMEFVNHFEEAAEENRKWLARGLQRWQLRRLVPYISRMRAACSDPTLRLMLLIAEVRQLDARSAAGIANDLDRVVSYSPGLSDSLTVFSAVTITLSEEETTGELTAMRDTFNRYLLRCKASLQADIAATKNLAKRVGNKKNNKARQALLARHRKHPK